MMIFCNVIFGDLVAFCVESVSNWYRTLHSFSACHQQLDSLLSV